MANPSWFRKDPELAWGFYGHRLNLYRNTIPHEGFNLLLNWSKEKSFGHFVFTSNVDGQVRVTLNYFFIDFYQFQKAGFDEDKIFEVHGSIHHIQCSEPVSCIHINDVGVVPAKNVNVKVFSETFKADPDTIPLCPSGKVI